MVGRPVLRFEEKGKEGQLKDIMVGDDASENRTMLQITYPVDKGKLNLPCANTRTGIPAASVQVAACSPPSCLRKARKKVEISNSARECAAQQEP